MDRTTLAGYCERQLPAMLALLREMVEINSFTGNAAGVNRTGELTAQAFALLGFDAFPVPSSNPAHGNHLVLRASAHDDRPTIALVSHLDTVFPEEEERRNKFHWRPEGTRIYGPGTNDIKGGTALMHLLLSALQETAPAVWDAANWVILLNACEEVSSADFRDLALEHLPKNTLACLVFEGDGGTRDDFSIVAARKGRATFALEVEGRAAHAGSSHRHGANAVVQLAAVVQHLHNLTDYDEDLTVNVGSIHGGGPLNRVPHFARAELEMRAFSMTAYAKAKQSILAHAGDGTIVCVRRSASTPE